jgi:hypothetical protein
VVCEVEAVLSVFGGEIWGSLHVAGEGAVGGVEGRFPHLGELV